MHTIPDIRRPGHGAIADGMTVEEITTELPDLQPEDVAEALHFAAEALRERRLPLRPSA